MPTNAVPNVTNYNQGINVAHAGTNDASNHGNNYSTAMLDRWLEPFSTLIQGTRCYTDASTQPDQTPSLHREAGIGVFIINTQVSPLLSIFIKAAMQNSTSVLTAESAAMMVAAVILQKLNLQEATYSCLIINSWSTS
jgi:hypothetical protein